MNAALLALMIRLPAQSAIPLRAERISFSCRAQTTDRVLALLSKASGVKFEASEPMTHEVLVVSAPNLPLRDLMSRIATASSGEWQPTREGFRLVAAEGLRRRQEADALARRTAAVRECIQKGVNPPKSEGAGNDATVQMNGMGMFGKGSKHAYEIIAAADPAAIAALLPNERIVFSTRPTPMQHPFGDDISSATTALIAEHDAEVAGNGATAGDAAATAFGGEAPAFLRAKMERMSKPVGPVSKVLLIISRMSFGGFEMISADVRMFDPAGKIAYDESTSLDVMGSGIAGLVQLGHHTGNPATPEKSTPIELSEETKLVAKVFNMGAMSNRATPIRSEVKAILFRPDLHDPLSFLSTDKVLALAKKQNRPVVADLSDDLSLAGMLTDKSPTVEEYEKELATAYTQEIVSDPAWLVIRPANPVESRETHLDRGALMALLQAADKKGVPSLDDIAQYALHNPSPMDGGIGMMYVAAFVPSVLSQGVSSLTSWEMLRVYGTLDPARRATLLSGDQIPLTSLTEFQVEQLRKMAFGAMGLLQVEDPSSKPEDQIPVYMRMFLGSSSNDYRDEPTELLPNGLPSNGFLTAKTTNELFASPVTSDGDLVGGTTTVLDAETLASIRLFRESPAFAQASSLMPNPTQARIGQRSNYAFTFHIAPKVTVAASLHDDHLDLNSAVVAMSALPAELNTEIEAKYAELKKSPLGMMAALNALGGNAGIHP